MIDLTQVIVAVIGLVGVLLSTQRRSGTMPCSG